MPRILLLGDFAFDNESASLKFDYDTEDFDLVVMNLEVPFPTVFDARPKAGPNLVGSFRSLSQIATSDFVLTMANNHIMDYGISGLKSTQKLLDEKGIRYCGVGDNIHHARQPIIVNIKGVKIGIIACCEAQFGVARRNEEGGAEFGPWIYSAIRDLCKAVDYVVVTSHAAVEDSPWPSPYIQELYRSFIEAGATVVHGHHVHVPQGYEAYGDGFIFYGMGNFAVDPNKWGNYPNGMWSLAAEIDFSSRPISWRPFTLEIRHQTDSDTICIEESNCKEQESHKDYLEMCNRPLGNPELFDAIWQEVALRAFYHYGAGYMGFSASSQSSQSGRAIKGLSMLKDALLNRIAPVANPTRNNYLLWYHMVACESHRQMLTTALGVLAGEIVDLRTYESHQIADKMMPWSVGAVPA